jgi:hypothetical protein
MKMKTKTTREELNRRIYADCEELISIGPRDGEAHMVLLVGGGTDYSLSMQGSGRLIASSLASAVRQNDKLRNLLKVVLTLCENVEEGMKCE